MNLWRCACVGLLACSAALPHDTIAQGADPLAAAVANGDWKQAETLARAALRADRESVTAWTYLGLAQEHEGNGLQALQAFAEAARLAPSATFTHNNYGASLEANGKSFAASKEYRRSLALDGKQPAALVNLARLRGAENTPQAHQEARDLLRSAWELAPDVEIAQSLLLMQPCASQPAADASPEAAVKAYGDAVASGATAVSPERRADLGHALLACGLAADAEKFASAQLAVDPRDGEAVALQAQAQWKEGHVAEAGRTLEASVAGGVENIHVYAELAQIYEQTNHMSNAVSAMRRALALAPEDPTLQFRYGMLLLDAHAPKAAEIRMQEAVKRQPTSARLWFVLGLAQFDQTRPAEAQASFDHALADQPTLAPALAYRGLVALDQQHYNEAESWYRRAIAADPSAADLHVLLAEALERQNLKSTSAIRTELQNALSISPKLASAYLMLGRLDLEDGQPAEARQALLTTLQLDPKLLQAHFYLARAYRQLHEPELAATEGKIFGQEQAGVEAADRAALQESARQLAHTAF